MLSLDIGTTKICLMELSEENSVLDTKVVDNKGTTVDDGIRHEQDPDVIYGQVQALLKGKEGDHLALTGQMHGFVLIDKDGNAKSPCITWRDQRIKGMHLASNPEKTGCKIHRGYAAGTLVWMMKQGYDLKGLKAVSLPGYIQGKLTGDYSIDDENAASWGIYDVKAHAWDWGLVDQLGLRHDLLPEIIPSASIVGLGGKLVVHAPVGDNQASVWYVTQGGGAAVLNLGDGGQMSIPVKSFAYRSGRECRPMPDGTFIQVYSSLCGGWAYDYLKDLVKEILGVFGQQVDDSLILDKMTELASQSDHSLGVNTRFAGTREDASLKGSITDIDQQNLTLGNLAYGFLEGMARELRDASDWKGPVFATGLSVRKNPVLQQIIKQMFPKTVVPRRMKQEEAAYGAALLVGT